MDWSVNDSFKRYACLFVFLKCFVLLVVFVDVSARLLPTCARNCVCVLSNVFAPPVWFAGLIFVVFYLFLSLLCLLLEVSTYCVCLCVFALVFAHVDLTFLFRTVSSSVEYKFALLTLSFKNFYIQSHCLPTFFFVVVAVFADRVYYFTIFRLDSSRMLFFLCFCFFF